VGGHVENSGSFELKVHSGTYKRGKNGLLWTISQLLACRIRDGKYGDNWELMSGVLVYDSTGTENR